MDRAAVCYRRFLDGEEQAFDEIMEMLFMKTVQFVTGYIGDFHAAEDIAMDVFSDLVVYRHRYTFKVSLKTYLFMLARSRALDYLKHGKILRFEDADAGNEVPCDSTPETDILKTEREKTLHAAVSKLPRDMQTVLYLVYDEELSYEEAAKVMKKSRKQIDNLVYRSKKELKTALEKEGADKL